MSSTTGLRRSVLQGRSKSQSKKGKGWRGGWKDRLDVPKASAIPVLLTRGTYPNPEDIDPKTKEPRMAHFHTCQEHGIKLKPRGTGSYYQVRCNIDAGDEDCVPCYAKGEIGDKRVGARPTFSFNVLYLALHHKVESTDRDGKVRRFESDGENHKRGDKIMEWAPVTRPRDLKEINADLGELVEAGEVLLFKKKYIAVGRGHRDQITLIDEEAEKLCRCGGDLAPVAFTCEGCKEEILDVEEENLDAEEVSQYAADRQRCDHCGHTGLPVPDPVCDSCDHPTPLTAFDVVAYIRKRGENTQSRIEVEKVVPLDEFELANGESMLEWDDSDPDGEVPVEDPDGNWVFTEEFGIEKSVKAGWNFDSVHAPRDHEYNASRLGIPVPRGFGASTHAGGGRARKGDHSNKYRNYGSKTRIPDKSEEVEDEEEAAPEKKTRRTRRSRSR